MCEVSRTSEPTVTAPSPSHPVPCVHSEEFVASLLDAVLSGGGGGRGSETGLVSAVHVLVPLLDVARPGMPPPIAGLPGRAAALLARLPQLHEALVSPPARPDLVTSWGRRSPPLGATRLQVARLVAALLATGMPEVHARLAALGTVDVLLVRYARWAGDGPTAPDGV